MSEDSRRDASYWDRVALLTSEGQESYVDGPLAFRSGRSAPAVGLEQAVARGTLVELGCGPGHALKFFATTASRIIGIDFSKGQLELARMTCDGCECVELIEHDLNDGLPPLDAKTDVFISIYGAVDFVRDPHRLLLECRGSLKQGGLIYIVTKVAALPQSLDSVLWDIRSERDQASGHLALALEPKVRQ